MTPFEFRDTQGKPGGSGLLDELVHRLRDAFRSLQNAVTNDRLFRLTFSAATTDTPLRHGLNAPVTTWEIVDRSANAVVWQSATVNAKLHDFLILQASAPVSVLIRVT